MRALDRLVASMELLTMEQAHWRPPAPKSNSVAGLVCHMLANVEENVLSVIAGGPGGRDRETEFTAAGRTTEELTQQWLSLRAKVVTALAALTADDLGAARTHAWRGEITVREVLLVVLRHTGEHEGQAQLTRDLVLSLGPFVD